MTRIIRYPHDYSRRLFLQRTAAAGALATGVLTPLWPALSATGDIKKVYPDELLSIEGYTKGKISTGGRITAANVHLVKDLLDPIRIRQITNMGRELEVVATTTDLMRLSPWEYTEATLRNQGQARFDTSGNVTAADGQPWIGGNPFPNPKNALEVFAGQTISWGRHDISLYANKEYDLGPEGTVKYTYQGVWAELAPVGRVSVDPKPYWPGHEDKLRYQSVIVIGPQEYAGASFLSIWDYDQNVFPDLHAYLPQFKRVRRLPSNQRFETLVPGSTLYLSDAWAAGDPFMTWGNYKITGQGPALAGLSGGWNPDHENWEHTTHGGPNGLTFWDTKVELVPESIIVEAEPVKFTRAPISRKKVWFDVRTMLPFCMVTFDRRGEVFRSFDGAYSLYESNGKSFMDGKHPYWSWAHVHVHDIQSDRLTRLEQVREIAGHKTLVNDQSVYDRYLTTAALRSFGK